MTSSKKKMQQAESVLPSAPDVTPSNDSSALPRLSFDSSLFLPALPLEPKELNQTFYPHIIVNGVNAGLSDPSKSSEPFHPVSELLEHRRSKGNADFLTPNVGTEMAERGKRHEVRRRLQQIVHRYADEKIFELIEADEVPVALLDSLMDRVNNERNCKMQKCYRWMPKIRFFMWKTLNEPEFSTFARLLMILLMALIALSVIAFCIETVPEHRQLGKWNWVEKVSITAFTIEYILRFVSCPNRKEFLTGMMNTVDLIAILPFYLELFLRNLVGSTSTSFFRAIRLIRIFRIFKLGRYLSWLTMLSDVFELSALPLIMLGFILCIGVVVLSSIMYFIERDQKPSHALQYTLLENVSMPMRSILDSFYWCIITITTVGYGDIYPLTTFGKLVASVTSICGILVLAIPISVVSQNFRLLYSRRFNIMKHVEDHRIKMIHRDSQTSADRKLRIKWMSSMILERSSQAYIEMVRDEVFIGDQECAAKVMTVLHEKMTGEI